MKPGYTQVPNEILKEIHDMSEAELKLTMAIVRVTYGYHKEDARMTWDDMCNDTGLSRPAVGRAIDAIENRGFFKRGRRSMWSVNSNKLLLNKGANSNNSELNEQVVTDENSNDKLPYDSNNKLPASSYKEKEEKKEDPPTPQNGKVEEIISAWNEAFPEKPTVTERNQSIRKKLTKQLRNSEFKDVWPDALKAAKQSAYLTAESWFNLDWFCGNGKNGRMPGYMRCLTHEFAWKDGQVNQPINSNGRNSQRSYQDVINDAVDEVYEDMSNGRF
jgi:phage replication O-like protein O